MFNILPTFRIGKDTIPAFKDLGTVGQNPNMDSLRKSVLRFHNLFAFELWPPFYEEVCDPKMENCFPINKLNYNLKLEAEFKLSFNENKKEYFVKDMVTFRRKSEILSSIEEKVKFLPYTKCEKRKPKPVPPRPADFNRGTNPPQ